MSATTVLGCAAGILIGVGATWMIGPRGAADVTAVPVAPTRLAAPAEGQARLPRFEPRPLEAEALRLAVREEVRAALRDQQSPAEAADPGPAEPTAAYQQARARVTERLAQGAWTERDREDLRATLGRMTAGERDELERKVIVAANAGALRVELEGPLF